MVNGALYTITGDEITLTGLLSWLEALHVHTLGYCYWWEDGSIRQLVLYEKNFSWMDVWEFNPEMLGSFWLTASATW
jgi:hypothetical protein